MSVAPLNILIHTEFDDLHALMIATALRERGHQVLRSLGHDLPLRSGIEFQFGGTSQNLLLHGDHTPLALDQVDVVWNRRPQTPALPTGLAEADREFVWNQLVLAQRAMFALADNAFWVNPIPAASATNLKPLQLKLAGPAGLAIPVTLISNEPAPIRAFLRRHPTVIYKPLHGHIWREDGREWGSYTARVTLDDLPADRLLRATPGIFQAQVAKQYEVRAQFFGDSCFAVRIDSQQIEYGEFDWRMHQHHAAMSRAITLPPAVHAACRALMRSLGLVAGGFDFIVTPDDQWVFLEVNEAGQFLFLEHGCPSLPLVDACCDFIESRDADFRYCPSTNAIGAAELERRHDFGTMLRAERSERDAACAAVG